MTESPWFRPPWLLLLMLIAAAGCAVPTPPADLPPPPVSTPLSEDGVQLLATVVSLEDRREFSYEPLAAAAGWPEPLVRKGAALALGRIGGDDARDMARFLVADPDSTVEAAALFSLGELADTGSTPLFAERLLPETSRRVAPNVAAEAADALGKIATAEAGTLIASYLLSADTAVVGAHQGVEAALLAGWRAGIPSIEPFARWAASSDARLRWRAVYALTRRARPQAASLLLRTVLDGDPLVRALSLRGLHQSLVRQTALAEGDVLEVIAPLLEDSAYSVRIEAIRAIASYGSGPAIQALLSIARSGNGHERAAALEGIGRIGSSAAGAASSMLRGVALDPGEHHFFRDAAIVALASVDSAALLEVASTLSADPTWRVRAALGRALASLDQPPLVHLQTLVRDEDPRVGSATVQGIAEWTAVERLTPFRGLLFESLHARDPLVRAASLTALSKIGDATLFPAFLDAYQASLQDSLNDAQLAAIDAIATLEQAGVPAPERAFYARFPRSPDFLVRQRARDRFGIAPRDWGDPRPFEVRSSNAQIATLVRRWIAPPAEARSLPRVLIETERGSLELELYPEDAPLSTANFLTLARSGFFDGQEWPRVVPNFVVQGGDPRGDTGGGPGYAIRDEINQHRYLAGSLGMALSGPDTGGSQFFITHSPQPHLDGIHTVFGRLVSGAAVLQSLLPGDKIIRVVELSDPGEI